MRFIIAGGRNITPTEFVKAIEQSKFVQDGKITTVLGGRADGVDSYGEIWAYLKGIKFEPYEADWNNLDAPGAVKKVRKFDGKEYNVMAGFDRNERMAQNADGLLLIYDGKSDGSSDMLQRAKKYDLVIEVIKVDKLHKKKRR